MNVFKAGLMAASFSLVSSPGLVQAEGSHSHAHEDTSSSKAREPMKKAGHGGNGHSDNAGHQGMGGHKHDRWEKPPKQYASLAHKDWDDTAAALRGGQLYAQQCVACHGVDGRGTGPAAAGLEHPPADLTNNFHTAPGDGDGYLFWRISEGGTVKPFSSMKSSMPSYKTILSEQQRWDVLTYIHQEFHGGFTKQPSKDNQSHNDASHDDHKSHSR